ncbi:hypothetical protein [Streptomyces kronopolitis]|nr:hypothetical protein [Streptomyces kronopolitis]
MTKLPAATEAAVVPVLGAPGHGHGVAQGQVAVPAGDTPFGNTPWT